MNESDSTIRSVQEVELSILRTFTELCEKYSLKYYLYGGTLIGAVRHGGFVPWDDDIDVIMPRDDYSRFLEIAKKELPSHLFLQHYTTDRGFYLLFAKIRDNNSTFIEDGTSHINMHKGIFIDIYPLDVVPQSKLLQVMEVNLLRTLWRLFTVKKFYYGSNLSIFKKLKIIIFKLLPVGSNTIIWIYEKICNANRNKNSRYLGRLVHSPHGKHIYEKAWFEERVKFRFEDKLYDAPAGYNQYLRHYYGNYLQLPPKEKRKPMHSELCDPNKPYMNMINPKPIKIHKILIRS